MAIKKWAARLVAAGCIFASAGLARAAVDQRSVVGMWLLDEGDGDIAQDEAGNEWHGAVSGDPDWTDEGVFGGAIDFDGVDDHIDFGADEALKPEEFTLVAWFSTRKLNGYGHIIQAGNDWNDMAGYLLRVHQNGNTNGALAHAPANGAIFIESAALSTETWYHAAFTFDGETAVLYLDGMEAGRQGAPGIMYDDLPLRVGTQSGGNVSSFDGILDELALFNVALELEDIEEIMTEGLQEATGILPVEPGGKLATTWGELRR